METVKEENEKKKEYLKQDMDDHQNAEQDKPEQPTEQNGGTEEEKSQDPD